jgi:phytanoyl-CoA hydroxylase
MSDHQPKPHPWNGDFAWHMPPGPYRALDDTQAKQFDEEGYVVLHDVIDAATVDRVEQELDRFEAETEAFLRQRSNERASISEAGAITFTTHLVARSQIAKDFATSRLFLDLCTDLLGPDARLYWDQAVYKKPEKPRPFPWHQDNGYAFVEPQQYLTCWVPLTDATIQNGCPIVAPGFHRQGTLAHQYVHPLGFQCFDDPPERVAVEVRRGGVVVFSSLTPHLTGPNVTESVRKAYILQYAPIGAAVLQGDPGAGAPTARVPCDAAERQFAVLAGGQPVVDQPSND